MDSDREPSLDLIDHPDQLCLDLDIPVYYKP